jgi:hypothetical protein
MNVIRRATGGIKGPIMLDRFCKRSASLWVMIGAVVFVSENVKAQEAEPRAFSNTPIGLNFLIEGYLYADGKMAFNPDLAIADANFNSNTALLAYVRSFELGGQSAKFDVIVPTSSFSAQGIVNGQPAERQMSGFGDPRFRVSVNLFGAPALSAKEGSIAGHSNLSWGFPRRGVHGRLNLPPAC